MSSKTGPILRHTPEWPGYRHMGRRGLFFVLSDEKLGGLRRWRMCVTANAKLADAIRRIRAYGQGDSQESTCEGVNSRLDEIQAAILEVKLRYLPYHLRRRRDLAAAYRLLLSAEINVPDDTCGALNSYHLFVIQTERRDEIIARLNDTGIGHGIHYPIPIHRMAVYRSLGYDKGSLPATEAAADRILSLPLYPEMSIGDVERVCSIVNRAHEV